MPQRPTRQGTGGRSNSGHPRTVASAPTSSGSGSSRGVETASKPLPLGTGAGDHWYDSIDVGTLQTISDAAAGFGDTISMGLTSGIRSLGGSRNPDPVDQDSAAYAGGQVAGVVHGLLAGGAKALVTAGKGVVRGARAGYQSLRSGLEALRGRITSIGGTGRSLGSAINPLRGTTSCFNSALALDATLAGSWAQARLGPAVSLGKILSVMGRSRFNGIFRSIGGVQSALANAGPGARAIVIGVTGRTGHAFNAVNRSGLVRLLDGQASGVNLSNFKKYYIIITNM